MTPTVLSQHRRQARARRPLRIYSESLSVLAADYAELSSRLIALDLTSTRSGAAIDQLAERLGRYLPHTQDRDLEQECLA
ncbi:MAG: hypothetical protein ABI343_06005 [Burkholderiaceae bacterium]